MDFTHTQERRLIGESLDRFLREQYSLEDRQSGIDSAHGYSESAWRALGDMGVIAALVSPDHGGFGGEGFDIALVFESLGRALSIEPWIASGVLGARTLAQCGDPLALLPTVLAGNQIVAFAHGEADSGYAVEYVSTRAIANKDNDWEITGTKAVVLHADNASHLLVSARTSGNAGDEKGLSLFVVDAALNRLSVQGYTTIDGFRAAEVTLDAVVVPADCLIGEQDDAYPWIEEAYAAASLAVCSEAVGVMEQALSITLDYLRTREQFGQPIGRFQALQHRMVDVATAIEQSRSLVIKAASVFADDRLAREIAVSAAKHYIGVAARLVGEESIQMHGGIGLAKETPISQYVKRLVMIDHAFGDTDYHLERYIALSR